MIASITAALPVGDAVASGSTSAAASEEAGAAFGMAVRNAGQKPEGCPNAKAGQGGENKAGETEKGEGKQSKGAAKGEDDAATEAASDAAMLSAGDILGRLLGGTPFVAQAQAQTPADPQGDDTAAGQDDELGERLVISTVVDLAGAVSGEMPKGQIALDVVRMETHFEPRLDGATLVEAEKAAASAAIPDLELPVAAPLDSEATPADRTMRKGFEEILQTLGRPSAETQAGSGGQSDADARSDGRAGAGNGRSGEKAKTTSEAAHALATSSPRNSEPTSASTGQIISSQVAERIVEAFAPERQSARTTASAASDTQSAQLLRMTAGGAALKTLTIQLQPQDLGRLDVSMRLVDGRLAVELSASEPSTAQALAGDRHTLRKLLEHAGFTVDDAAITVVSREMGQSLTASPAGGSSSDMQGGSSDRRQGGAFEGNRDGSNGGSSSEQRFTRRREDVPERAQPRSSGSVFL